MKNIRLRIICCTIVFLLNSLSLYSDNKISEYNKVKEDIEEINDAFNLLDNLHATYVQAEELNHDNYQADQFCIQKNNRLANQKEIDAYYYNNKIKLEDDPIFTIHYNTVNLDNKLYLPKNKKFKIKNKEKSYTLCLPN